MAGEARDSFAQSSLQVSVTLDHYHVDDDLGGDDNDEYVDDDMEAEEEEEESGCNFDVLVVEGLGEMW